MMLFYLEIGWLCKKFQCHCSTQIGTSKWFYRLRWLPLPERCTWWSTLSYSATILGLAHLHPQKIVNSIFPNEKMSGCKKCHLVAYIHIFPNLHFLSKKSSSELDFLNKITEEFELKVTVWSKLFFCKLNFGSKSRFLARKFQFFDIFWYDLFKNSFQF